VTRLSHKHKGRTRNRIDSARIRSAWRHRLLRSHSGERLNNSIVMYWLESPRRNVCDSSSFPVKRKTRKARRFQMLPRIRSMVKPGMTSAIRDLSLGDGEDRRSAKKNIGKKKLDIIRAGNGEHSKVWNPIERVDLVSLRDKR